MGRNGFIYWEIFHENCTAAHFQSFIDNSKNCITTEDMLLFDNASIQVEEQSLAVVDEVFGGRWKRVPAYSSRLSPVERGFAMIWAEVRRNSEAAMAEPVGTINTAFEKYAVGGPEGYVGKKKSRESFWCVI